MKNSFYILSFFLSFQLLAQPENPVTPSASTMSFSKYADIEPNLYNGALSVPIPIATITEGSIALPVSLNYHTSGLRAHELATEVGLGWHLSAGGAVTRRVLGVADDKENKGFFDTGSFAQNGNISQYFNDLKKGDKDFQADIFTYNIGGVSGNFVFDHLGNVHQLEQSDITIEFISGELPPFGGANRKYSYFQITLTDGTEYLLGDNLDVTLIERNVEKIAFNNEEYISSWYLYKIRSADASDSIRIHYDPFSYRYLSLQDCQYLYSQSSSCEMLALEIEVNSKIPYLISGTLMNINFDYFSSGRLDLLPPSSSFPPLPTLDKIRVSEGSYETTYKFDHSYFYDNTSNAIPTHLGISAANKTRLKYRLKLDQVTVSAGAEVLPPYQFDYYGLSGTANGTFFPAQLSQAIDSWGYYNGATDNNDEDHIIPSTAGNWQGNNISVGLAGVGRDPVYNSAIAGNLRAITYPYGGTTLYEYELNSYWENKQFMQNSDVHSATDFNCTIGSGNAFSQQIYIDQTEYDYGILRLNLTPICGGLGTALLQLKTPDTVVAQLSLYNSIQDSTSIELINTNVLPNQYYTLVINVDNAIGASNIYSTGNGSEKKCGGLRIKETTTDDGLNINPDIVRSYKYTLENDNTSGLLFRAPIYLDDDSYQYYPIVSTNSIYALQSFQGHHVGYKSVLTDYNGNGTKRVDFYTSQVVQDSTIFTYPIPEIDKPLIGHLRRTQIISETGDTLSTTRNYIGNQYNLLVPSINYAFRERFGPAVTSTSVKPYNVNTGIYKMDVVDSNLEGVKTSTQYDYDFNKHLNPIKIQTRDAQDRNVYSQDLFYTTDYNLSNQSTILPYFNDHNIVIPFRITSLKNDVILNRSFDRYNIFNTHARVSEKYDRSFNSPSSWLTDITTINAYDLDGKPTSITPPGGLATSTFSYTTSRLLETSSFGGLTKSYSYEPNTALLSSMTNVDGTQQSFTYDDLKRLSSSTSCTGIVMDIDYNIVNNNKSYTETTNTYPSDQNGLSQYVSDVSRQYVDGLGRPLQTVGKGQSPDGKDLVSAIAYDNQGRAYRSFEVFKSSNSNAAYVTPSLSAPFTNTVFEPSTLNRKISTTPPDWNSTPTQYSYGSNTTLDSIVDHENSGFYAPNTLFKKSMIDGNGNRSISFIDEAGRTILTRRSDATDQANKRLDTYTLYDNRDRVVQVIPPASTKDDPDLNYYYQYDAEGKVTQKQIPSMGTIDYVYNNRDLLIAQRDSFLINENQWYVSNYDTLNRRVKSGFHNNAGVPSGDNPTIHQLLTEDIYGTTQDIRLGKIIASKNLVLNTSNMLTNSPAYDNCGRLAYTVANNHLNLSAQDTTKFYYDGSSSIVKTTSQITDHNNLTTSISQLSYVDEDGRNTAQWIDRDGSLQQLSAFDYTFKNEVATKYIGGNPSQHLQQVDYNYLDNGMLHQVNQGTATGGDLYGYQLNYYQAPSITNTSSGTHIPQYNGNIASMQWAAVNETAQLEVYNYDYLDRLTDNYSNNDKYNTAYEYDDRGNFLSIERYTSINNLPSLIDDLTPQYHANNANQLLSITESSVDDKGYKSQGNSLTYKYDNRGNMIEDPHKGITMTYNHLSICDTITWEDGRQIIFTYAADGSLLRQQNLDQGVLKTQDYLGELEYIDSLRYAIHHSEGRLVNNGIEAHLNYIFLDHQQIVDGVFKAKSIESIGTIIQDETDYTASDCIVIEGGFAVDDNAIFSASVLPPPTYVEDWKPEWDVRDHLGNLRMTYDSNKEVTQRIDYYPYGMRRMHYETSVLKNNYQYNGIEHINDFGLDLNMATYRSLDGALGMWGQVDPKAELMQGYSPYNAMANNPILHTDPNGDVIPIVAAAIVGSVVGAGANMYTQYKNGNLNSFGDWVGAGVIGGVSGGVGAVAGTAAIMGSAAFVAGGAATVGATGVSVGGYTLGTTGFVSGAISGTVGGAVSSPLRQIGNMIAGWQDEFSHKEWLGETLLGFGVGGAVGGLTAAFKGQNFWWGNSTKIIPNGGIALGELENATPTALDGGWNKLYSKLDQSIDYAMKSNKFDHILYGSANSDHGLQKIIQENFRGNNKAFMRTVLNNMSINNSVDITLGQVFKNVRVGIGANQVFARGFATSDGILKLSGITIRPY